MNRAARATATLFLLTLALQARGQPTAPAAPEAATLRGESAQTRKRLIEIEQKMAAGKHADAADDLQRVLDESGDDLILVEANHARPARWVAHQLLAKLPADVLKAYQDRVEQPAKKLLAQGKATRDPRPLWQLLDRYFASRPADEALLLLGDLLFERGEFRAAEGTWRRLLPDDGADIAYPNSKADFALVRARIVLSIIFSGDVARAKEAFDDFKAKHATATGPLAGKTGLLVNTLKTFLDAPPKLAPEAAANAWPTYGGGPDRTGRVAGGIPQYWPSRASWEESLPVAKDRAGDFRNPPARSPFGHPVITNGEVFVADATRVFGFGLQTGARTRSYSPFLNVGTTPKNTDAAASLTASGGLLFARFGPSVVRAPEAVAAGKLEESFLFCLKPEGNELKFMWKLAPSEDAKVPTAWEGAPLVVGKRLWAVYAKFEGGRVIHVAVGYDPIEGDTEPQRPVWATELCDSSQTVASEGRTRQELLTLAGRHLVFNSNSGAVVALDASTGQRAWGFRYPRARAASPSNDPSPAIAFGGRVFVAPADGEHVYALDALTGQLAWESGPTEGARILGIARDKFIVSVTGPLRGLRGLALDTGSHYRDDGGWVQSNGPGVLSYGQGFVTDDVIVWPSREGLCFLDPVKRQHVGGSPNPGVPIPNFLAKFFGNVTYADGVLVVVTATQVWGYRAEPNKIIPRPDSTPTERFNRLIVSAEREYATDNRAKAKRLLSEIATSDLPTPLRAWAAARLIQWSPRVTDPKMLPPNALLPELMSEWLFGPDGIPVTLETFLHQHLGQNPRAASVPTPASANKPCLPGLGPEAEFDRTFKLPAAMSPLRTVAGASCPSKHIFAAGLRKLIAIPLDQSAESEHTAPDIFTHGANLREGFVACGPAVVAVYGSAREPVWVFRVPATERLPTGPLPFRLSTGNAPPAESLSSFMLAGTWLFARVGECHLIALDLEARRVAWVLGTTGQSGYEPLRYASVPRFGPNFAVSGKFVVAQLSDGRRWFITLETGHRTALPGLGESTALVNWPHTPTEAGNYLALADGPGTVRFVHLTGHTNLFRFVQLRGRVKWVYEVEHEGLAGDPPQVRAWGDNLLLAVRRNHGIDIECVSATDGKAMWDVPAFADAFAIDLSAADADAERAYVPVGNKLMALTLSSGKTAWALNLPSAPGGWVVRAGKSCVIAYPAQPIAREATEAVLGRLTKSFRAEPFVWRLPGLATTLYDAWVDRALPVLLFDPETGKRVGSYAIPARGPAVRAWFDAGTAVFATGDRVVWLK